MQTGIPADYFKSFTLLLSSRGLLILSYSAWICSSWRPPVTQSNSHCDGRYCNIHSECRTVTFPCTFRLRLSQYSMRMVFRLIRQIIIESREVNQISKVLLILRYIIYWYTRYQGYVIYEFYHQVVKSYRIIRVEGTWPFESFLSVPNNPNSWRRNHHT